MLQQKSEILANGIIKVSEEFKKFFLLQFTKELIKHSGVSEVFELENILKKETHEKKEEIKKEIKQIIKEKKELPLVLKEKFPLKKLFKPFPKPIMIKPRLLRIPEQKLPPQFQYLTPSPTNIQIDLEKLNPLIKDPAVRAIECNGPDENIIVRGTMGIKRTNIILDKKEINQIIKKFSETTKIPFHEGIFRVVVGRLILSSIVSEVIGSKFIIKKMIPSPVSILKKY